MRNRYKLRTRPEQSGELLEKHFSIVVDRRDTNHGTHLFRQQLPWNNVGMVLKLREDDLVALTDIFSPVTLCHEINCLGRASQEDNFLRVRCPEELPDFFASSFEQVGCSSGKGMGGAMNV